MQSVAVLLVSGFIATVLAADGKFGPIPKCVCDGLLCECCAGFSFRKQAKSVCLNTNYNANELIMQAELTMDGTVIASKTIGPDFVPFCVPVAPLKVCLNARKVFFSQGEAKVCAALDVKMGFTSIFKARLPCLTMANGIFQVTKN